mgnify:CR=1 FL=1
MKKIYIVANPFSGGGKCSEKVSISAKLLKDNGFNCHMLYSQKIGEIPMLIHQSIQSGAECIVVAGGDGTMREAVEALVYQDVPAFLFPFGTGNDLALALGISSDPEQCVRQLSNGSIKNLDAGMVNSSYFLNVAGLGFDVEVLIQTERYKKRFKAKSAYRLGLIHALLNLRQTSVTIRQKDAETRFGAMITSIGNGRFIGGGMEAHPLAEPSDGLLDLCAIHDLKKRQIPLALFRFLKGRHLDLPATYYARGDEFTVDAEMEMPIQLDGEIIEKTPAIFKVLPGAVKFIL